MNLELIANDTRAGKISWRSGTDVDNFFNRFGGPPHLGYFADLSVGEYIVLVKDSEETEFPMVMYSGPNGFNAISVPEDGVLRKAKELYNILKEG